MTYAGRKVVFVCLDDANDWGVLSGGPRSIIKGFRELGCEVINVSPIRPLARLAYIPKKAAYRAQGRYYHYERERLFLKLVARHVEQIVQDTRPDLVMVAQPPAATYLNVSCPVAITHDQTFSERLSYFPFEKRPPAQEYVDKALRQEGVLFRNVDLIAYPSQRTINTIRDLYGIPDHKLAFIPWGGNLPTVPSREQALAWLAGRSFEEIVITFIGVDWPRKGGDIALAAVSELRNRGVKVRFNVIGTVPPEGAGEHVTVIPRLDKALPADWRSMEDILSRSHLLFVPSRVEAFGHAFCEAAAFAVPSIATDVGGIPTIIIEGINGRLLPLAAGGREFADVIQECIADEQQYRTMARASRDRFDRTLNWTVFCRSVLDRTLGLRSPNTEPRRIASDR